VQGMPIGNKILLKKKEKQLEKATNIKKRYDLDYYYTMIN